MCHKIERILPFSARTITLLVPAKTAAATATPLLHLAAGETAGLLLSEFIAAVAGTAALTRLALEASFTDALEWGFAYRWTLRPARHRL